MRYLAPFLVLALAACSTPIEMYNPKTGATATCGPFSMAGGGHSATAREAQCIRDYKEQGYVRR